MTRRTQKLVLTIEADGKAKTESFNDHRKFLNRISEVIEEARMKGKVVSERTETTLEVTDHPQTEAFE